MEQKEYTNFTLQQLYELFTDLNQQYKTEEADVIFKVILEKEKLQKGKFFVENLASLSDRLAAALLDFLIITIPFIAVLIVGYKFINFAEALGKFGLVFNLINLFVSQSLFLLINANLLRKNGQTVGKKIMSIKIVDTNNRIPPFFESYVLRYFVPALLMFVPVFGLVMALIDFLLIFSRERKCVHDHLAGTKVVSIE